jgi:hypothetical protein
MLSRGRGGRGRATELAIDGSKIGRQPQTGARERDSYNSPVIGFVAQALFWVPIVAIVWFAYWSGTWMGGWVWGVISVVSALATVAVLWVMRRRKRT